MKHLLITFLVTACVLLACQKTINWNLDAVASLAKDSTDNCLPITVHGVYKPGIALNDSNYVVVSVIVDSPGQYNIFTNIVNGYQFKASGTFASKGLTDVKLISSGTPLDIGVDNFSVHLNFSSCSFSITVPSDTSNSGNVDTVYSGVSGTLKSEEQTSTASYFMWYDSTGVQLKEITSDNQPFRKIFYTASNTIDKIDYYTGTSSYTFDHTAKFIYDNNNNVVAQLQYSQDGIFEDSLFSFEYDASNNLTKTTQYESGSIKDEKSYVYDASGNITKVYTLSASSITDSVTFQYDSRQNNFKQIYPQYVFLDPLVSGNVNYAFYFSANYPVNMILGSDKSLHPIIVDTNANGKPSDIKIDGNIVFTYTYN